MGKSSKSDRKKDAKHKKKASSSRAKHSKRKRSDTGSSDSGSEPDAPELDLKRGERRLRRVMSDHLGLADEAGGVLLALDAGEAVVLDGIANKDLRSDLAKFLAVTGVPKDRSSKAKYAFRMPRNARCPSLAASFAAVIEQSKVTASSSRSGAASAHNEDDDADDDMLAGPTLPSSPPASPSADEAPAAVAPDPPPKRRRVLGPALPTAAEAAVAPAAAAPEDDSDGGVEVAPHPGAPAAATAQGLVGGVKEEEEGDDDEVVGPVLPSHPSVRSSELSVEEARARFEQRQRQAAKDWARARGEAVSDDEDATKQRQSWMMAPPTDRPSVLPASTADMRSRTFSKKGREPGKVAEEWTMTPEERARHFNKKQDRELLGVDADAGASSAADQAFARMRSADESIRPMPNPEADAETAQLMSRFNETHRATSLLEAHQKKRSKQKPETQQPRRPFDRERDLGIVKQASAQQVHTLVQQSGLLGTRFSVPSGERRFL